jgi:hypothetical protein
LHFLGKYECFEKCLLKTPVNLDCAVKSHLQTAHKPNLIDGCYFNSVDRPFNNSLSGAPAFGCIYISYGCFLKTALKSNILLSPQILEADPPDGSHTTVADLLAFCSGACGVVYGNCACQKTIFEQPRKNIAH